MIEKLQHIVNVFYGNFYDEEELSIYERAGCIGLRNERPWDLAVITFGLAGYLFFTSLVTKEMPFLIPISLFGLFMIYCGMQEDIERQQRNNKILRENSEELAQELAKLYAQRRGE